MTANIKVGDRVLVTGKMSGKIFNRVAGTVLHIADNSCPLYHIQFDKYINGHNSNGRGTQGFCWNIKPSEEVKIEKVGGFKVGDKVRLNKNVPASWWGKPGMEGTVCNIRFSSEYDIEISGHGTLRNVASSMFDLIDATPAAPERPLKKQFIVSLYENGQLHPAKHPVMHPSFAVAQNEAARLTKVHKKTFVVFEMSSVLVPEVATKVVEEVKAKALWF